MIEKILEIEKNQKAKKEEIAFFLKGINDKSDILNYIEKWLNSDDEKMLNLATSFIDEIGEINPELCLRFKKQLIEIIASGANRLKWGAMTAIESFAHLESDYLFNNLDKIVNASDTGSVISKDAAVSIYCKLGSLNDEYYNTCSPLILESIERAADNQVGQYTEKFIEIIKKDDLSKLMEIIRLRLSGFDNKNHIRRAEKSMIILEKKLKANK